MHRQQNIDCLCEQRCSLAPYVGLEMRHSLAPYVGIEMKYLLRRLVGLESKKPLIKLSCIVQRRLGGSKKCSGKPEHFSYVPYFTLAASGIESTRYLALGAGELERPVNWKHSNTLITLFPNRSVPRAQDLANSTRAQAKQMSDANEQSGLPLFGRSSLDALHN